MNELNLFDKELKKLGLRTSKTRVQIFTCLLQAPEPLSIQQIISYVQVSHFVSVYRSLDVLNKAGLIKRVPIGLKYKYELSDDFRPHHHHATCEICGRTFKIVSSNIETTMDEVTREVGLRPTRHYFEVYGVCSRH